MTCDNCGKENETVYKFEKIMVVTDWCYEEDRNAECCINCLRDALSELEEIKNAN